MLPFLIGKMKTFQEFLKETQQVTEFFGFNPPPPKPAPAPKEVLAYKNYQSGVLDKSTGKFTQRPFTKPEQQRYGWKPVNVSSYSKTDTPGSKTASGEKFSDTSRGVAVPYASKTGSKPSVPFGTQIQMTKAPGTGAPVATTHSFDTGNFGKAGKYNKNVSFDLARQTAADVSGKPGITSKEFGKQTVYAKVVPSKPKVDKSKYSNPYQD
jgi:hypothetical protein